ncbi:MAG: hypothetical protein Q4G09_05105 [Clostridia bacterium]|nr:hypothetical protein [Clostridia bacterium]
MKIFTNKRLIKKISILIICVTLLTLFIPPFKAIATNTSTEDGTAGAWNPATFQAEVEANDEEQGGKLFQPIAKFFAGIGDLVIKGLQEFFIGDGNIQGEGIEEMWQEGAFLIRYSPGIIFSNKVPGLDANFISPMDNIETETVNVNWEKFDEDRMFNLKEAEDVEYLKKLRIF